MARPHDDAQVEETLETMGLMEVEDPTGIMVDKTMEAEDHHHRMEGEVEMEGDHQMNHQVEENLLMMMKTTIMIQGDRSDCSEDDQ